MTHLELELKQLKLSTINMMNLVKSQLEKAETAFFTVDKDLAREILFYERHINALDLKIDRDCENIFALFNPVAVDLRFVLSALKINYHLERIGDNLEGVAYQVIDLNEPYTGELLQNVELKRAFEIVHSMITDIINSLETEDTSISRTVLQKDEILNQINIACVSRVNNYIIKNNLTCDFEKNYNLVSVIKKLERMGDLLTNVAEEIIFYVDAKVLRHKKN